MKKNTNEKNTNNNNNNNNNNTNSTNKPLNDEDLLWVVEKNLMSLQIYVVKKPL